MLGQRRRRWPNIKTTLSESLVFAGISRNIDSLIISTHNKAFSVPFDDCDIDYFSIYIVPLDMKGCICQFTKWQLHPFISKVTYTFFIFVAVNLFRLGLLFEKRSVDLHVGHYIHNYVSFCVNYVMISHIRHDVTTNQGYIQRHRHDSSSL